MSSKYTQIGKMMAIQNENVKIIREWKKHQSLGNSEHRTNNNKSIWLAKSLCSCYFNVYLHLKKCHFQIFLLLCKDHSDTLMKIWYLFYIFLTKFESARVKRLCHMFHKIWKCNTTTINYYTHKKFCIQGF